MNDDSVTEDKAPPAEGQKTRQAEFSLLVINAIPDDLTNDERAGYRAILLEQAACLAHDPDDTEFLSEAEGVWDATYPDDIDEDE